MKKIKFVITSACLAAIMACNPQTQENSETMKAQNEVIETIMARRSIRQYKPEAVNKETMNIILECGINAPNGMNRQSWEVRVMNDPQVIAKLKEHMVKDNPQVKPEMVEGCFSNAPTLVFVANDTAYDFSSIDCGLLSENIMLSAWSLGVGSVCLASPIRFIKNSPQALEMLGFGQGYNPIICIGLGYANETPDAKPRDINKVKYVEL